MALRDDQRFKIREEVLSRLLDDEAVLLDLQSGTYFGLNEVGAAIWEMIQAGATVAEIRTRVLERYEIDRTSIDHDLERLVADLEGRGLIDGS